MKLPLQQDAEPPTQLQIKIRLQLRTSPLETTLNNYQEESEPVKEFKDASRIALDDVFSKNSTDQVRLGEQWSLPLMYETGYFSKKEPDDWKNRLKSKLRDFLQIQ